MSNPLVSICIPTYNRLALLQAAVQSCLAQTFTDFDIVITDNSDRDDSEQWVRQLNDPRIRYHRNERNLGGAGNFSKAISLARGKYVKLLMDDDLMKPEFLALTVAALEKHPTAGVAMAPMDLIDVHSAPITPRFYLVKRMHYRYRYRVGDGLIDRKTLLRDFLTRDYPCCVPSGVLFRKEFFDRFGGNDPAADFGQDLDLCMRAAVHYDFYYIDQVLSSWRYFPENHTATLHRSGYPIHVFYYITRKILSDPEARRIFAGENWQRLERQSYYFASCRCLLNLQAALFRHDPRIIASTFATIWREDPYRTNLLRLPFSVLGEVWTGLFPAKLPPPPRDGCF
ncbi:MAG: glycosyltransferase [Planctomycetia bacterium]|nr:glycosyltransferase [Planctomycetia bacterium]